MPHQCTNCGHTFADGSKEMLSGCPDCGGNKFQFRPAGSVDADETPAADAPDPSTEREGGLTDAAARAGAAVRDRLSGSGDTSERARPPNDPDRVDAADADSVGKADAVDTPADAAGDADTAESSDPADSTASTPAPSEGTDPGRRRLDADERAWPGQPADEGDASPDSTSHEVESSPDPADDAEVITDEDEDQVASSESNRTREPGVDSGQDDEPRPGEDRAQADARSGTVSEDELSAAAESTGGSQGAESASPSPTATDPAADATDDPGTDSSPDSAPPPDADGTVIEPEDDEKPDLTDLRQELNDQFESIKIVNPGQYELNLMELYDREEYIISLQEDGKYVIEVPDRWTDDE